MEQLELPLGIELKPRDKVEYIEYKVGEIHCTTERVRKSIYARHNELKRRCAELEERLFILEKHICWGK